MSRPMCGCPINSNIRRIPCWCDKNGEYAKWWLVNAYVGELVKHSYILRGELLNFSDFSLFRTYKLCTIKGDYSTKFST